ncbi:YlxR family protein [Trueperella pecoris]|uniref:YlxR family protein n=1 Tax=Trueperella pecoris TaxID=2733571 RepID=UPI00350EF7DD
MSTTSSRAPNRQRTCIGCRGVVHTDQLLRIAVKDGVAFPDFDCVAGGRGAWVHPAADCVKLALRKRSFNRAFLGEVNTEPVQAWLDTIAVGIQPER